MFAFQKYNRKPYVPELNLGGICCPQQEKSALSRLYYHIKMLFQVLFCWHLIGQTATQRQENQQKALHMDMTLAKIHIS